MSELLKHIDALPNPFPDRDPKTTAYVREKIPEGMVHIYDKACEGKNAAEWGAEMAMRAYNLGVDNNNAIRAPGDSMRSFLRWIIALAIAAVVGALATKLIK